MCVNRRGHYLENKMADVSDIVEKLDDARRFAIQDGDEVAKIRSRDGMEMLLIEVISELRDISGKLDNR